MVYGSSLYREDVSKVSFVLRTYQDFLDAAAAFPDLKAGTWGGSGETALFGDLGVKDITKAHAIDVLLAHLGAERADTIAFASCIQKGTPIGYPCPFAKKMKEIIAKDLGEGIRFLDYTH